MVYVLSIDGNPLMPCKEAKARKLLKNNKAKVIQKIPFTIQLLFECENKIEDISLGVDAGSKMIGISATTKKKELFSAEVELRNDIVKLISNRKQLRHARRSRKTRYRKARFLNRKKPKGWLAPSIQHKVNSHIKMINIVHNILPIKNIIIELAQFDMQKIKNPNIQGIEYQQGDMLGFWNVREYVLYRDNYTCQHCKGKNKDKILQVHHKESRKTGGNSPDNLITVCKTCHKNYHNGKIIFNFKRNQSLRDASFMNIMRNSFYEKLKNLYNNINITYGYITKTIRIKNNLEKSHRIDALCISGNPQVKQLGYYYYYKKVRNQNRQLYKAKKLKGNKLKANKLSRFIFGYQLHDYVLYNNKEYIILSRRSRGHFNIGSVSDKKIKIQVTYKKLKLIMRAKSYLIERKFT